MSYDDSVNKFLVPEQLKYYDWLARNEDKDTIVTLVNWDNLIFKFLMFINDKKHKYKGGTYYPGEDDIEVRNGYIFWQLLFLMQRE